MTCLLLCQLRISFMPRLPGNVSILTDKSHKFVVSNSMFDLDDDEDNSFEIVDNEYGNSYVRMLHLKRDGLKDTINEFEIDTSLTLDSTIDYTEVCVIFCQALLLQTLITIASYPG